MYRLKRRSLIGWELAQGCAYHSRSMQFGLSAIIDIRPRTTKLFVPTSRSLLSSITTGDAARRYGHRHVLRERRSALVDGGERP
jgi:hypothetical protein